MKYNFDEIIDRTSNYSAKWLELRSKFGRDDVLPMWVADMDFKSPKPVIEAIKERANQGIYGYTTRPESYFDAITNWQYNRHGWNVDKDLLLHCPGVVFSISLIIQEFTDPGDKIIIQPPVYYPFFSLIENNNRKIVYNPLKKIDNKYIMDFNDLENKIDKTVKMLILCSPHNPVGRVWERDELFRLAEICRQNNIRVVSDEIHGDIVYEGYKFTPFGTLPQELTEGLITCFAPSKTFNLAGLQASITAFTNKKDYTRFEGVLDIFDLKRNNCFNIVATEAAYNFGEEWLEELIKYLQGNINFLIEYINDNFPDVKVYKPQGTFLVWLDFTKLGMNKELLSHFIINKAKVALDDGYWFGKEGEGYLRINVACPRIILETGLKRIKEAISKYRQWNFKLIKARERVVHLTIESSKKAPIFCLTT